MTPKEKANELVMTYSKKSNNLKQRTDWNYDKQCALIAVEELIKEQTMWQNGQVNPVLYWQEVKTEIEMI